VPVSATINARSGRAARQPTMAGRLRRACNASIACAPSRGPPVTGASLACTITRYFGASSRAQRAAVRQLPLFAAAIRSDEDQWPVPERTITRTKGAEQARNKRLSRRGSTKKPRCAMRVIIRSAFTRTDRGSAATADRDRQSAALGGGPRRLVPEFWAAPPGRRSAGSRTPSRIANADALWNSSTVPHATRYAGARWPALHAYLDATLADTLDALAGSREGERYF
jgi:hypothetical protein